MCRTNVYNNSFVTITYARERLDGENVKDITLVNIYEHRLHALLQKFNDDLHVRRRKNIARMMLHAQDRPSSLISRRQQITAHNSSIRASGRRYHSHCGKDCVCRSKLAKGPRETLCLFKRTGRRKTNARCWLGHDSKSIADIHERPHRTIRVFIRGCWTRAC